METIIKKKTMMYVFVAGETTIVKPFFVYPEEKKIKTGDLDRRLGVINKEAGYDAQGFKTARVGDGMAGRLRRSKRGR
jgi:hypothetical protein